MTKTENSPCRILVTGATGNTGRPIATELAAQGFTVRTATPHDPPAGHRGEHVRFDWNDSANHADVLAGVDRMYLIAPGLIEAPERLMIPFIERAHTSGVRRVVVLSSSAIAEGMPGLGRVHQFIRAQVPEWTVLQPSWFMQNFISPRNPHSQSIQRDQVIITATGDGRVAFVDAQDIAAVAARALSDKTPHDTAHVITGPEALSYGDVAALISQAAGRAIRHRAASAEELIHHLVGAGVPAAYARLLASLDERIRCGEQSQVTQTVRQVTGRNPRSFAAFAKAHAACWKV